MPSPARSLLVAPLLAAALCAGCEDRPTTPGAGSDPPLAVQVSLVDPPGSPPASLPDREVRLTIYDVTGDPFVETDQLLESTPLVDVSRSIFVPEGGVGFFDESFELADQPRDYRILVNVFISQVFNGTRTLLDLRPGTNRTVDLYLTAAGIPQQGTFGVQVADSWASPGDPHLIPVVLVASEPVGGFQFDLVVDPGVVTGATGLEVDPDSRLYLGRNASVLANLGVNAVSPDTLRVVAFSEEPATRPIAAGRDVILFVGAQIAESAFADTLRVGRVVVSTVEGQSLPVSVAEDGLLGMRGAGFTGGRVPGGRTGGAGMFLAAKPVPPAARD